MKELRKRKALASKVLGVGKNKIIFDSSKLAKYHEKLNNQKENYLHQISNQLLDENQIIVMENLNVSGMMKNHCLAQSIQEMSLSHFKTMLVYKSEWFDRQVIEIDRWFASSKLCSVCGYKKDDLTLKNREWVCPGCNTLHNRDLNAAINIKNEGLKLLKDKIGCRAPELTFAERKSFKTLDEAKN